jgi:uncharacterized cupredoxin-like copper-binding protein
MRLLFAAMALAGAAAVSTACGGDDNASSTTTRAAATGSATPSGNAVDVNVQEWSINPSVNSVKAGSITFNVQNIGPKEEHEFVVLKTDLAFDQLPRLADGAVDESAAVLTSPGEIEGMGAGEHKSGTLDLLPGKYLFICNLIDQGEGQVHVHFREGMHTAFTAE